MSSMVSTSATHSQISWRKATSVPFASSMRAIIIVPIAVSSSTQGRIDWLA